MDLKIDRRASSVDQCSEALQILGVLVVALQAVLVLADRCHGGDLLSILEDRAALEWKLTVLS